MDNLRKTRGITLHYTELLPPPELVFLGAERDVLNSHDNPLRQLSAVPVPVNAHQPLGPALLPHGADQPASSRELFKQVGRDRRGRGAHVDAVVRRALQVSPSAVTEHEDELPRVQEGPRAWIPPAVLLAGPVQAGDVLQTDRQPSLPSHHVRHHRGQVTAAAPHLFVYTVIVESERGARRRKRDFCRGQPRPLSLSLSLSLSLRVKSVSVWRRTVQHPVPGLQRVSHQLQTVRVHVGSAYGRRGPDGLWRVHVGGLPIPGVVPSIHH